MNTARGNTNRGIEETRAAVGQDPVSLSNKGRLREAIAKVKDAAADFELQALIGQINELSATEQANGLLVKLNALMRAGFTREESVLLLCEGRMP